MTIMLDKLASESLETVFRLAQDELLSLLQQHDQLVAKIASVKQSLIALSELFGDQLLRKDLVDIRVRAAIRPAKKKAKIGLTSALRRVLVESRRQLTVKQTYQLLLSQFRESIEHHKSPTSSITTVLNRLTASGELVETRNAQDIRVWEIRDSGKFHVAHAGD
jgi:hypothetical protein